MELGLRVGCGLRRAKNLGLPMHIAEMESVSQCERWKAGCVCRTQSGDSRLHSGSPVAAALRVRPRSYWESLFGRCNV